MPHFTDSDARRSKPDINAAQMRLWLRVANKVWELSSCADCAKRAANKALRG